MEECPYCGNEEYYTKDYMYGMVRYMQRFDGKEADNGDMYSLLRQKLGKYAYCFKCDKRLFKIKEDSKC